MIFKTNNGIQSLEVGFYRASTQTTFENLSTEFPLGLPLAAVKPRFWCRFRLEVECCVYNRGNSSTTFDLLMLIEILNESRIFSVSCGL